MIFQPDSSTTHDLIASNLTIHAESTPATTAVPTVHSSMAVEPTTREPSTHYTTRESGTHYTTRDAGKHS